MNELTTEYWNSHTNWNIEMHVKNYVCACLISKFNGMHILLRVQERVKHKPPKLHARNYFRTCMSRQYVHILSHVITSTRETRELPKERY